MTLKNGSKFRVVAAAEMKASFHPFTPLTVQWDAKIVPVAEDRLPVLVSRLWLSPASRTAQNGFVCRRELEHYRTDLCLLFDTELARKVCCGIVQKLEKTVF